MWETIWDHFYFYQSYAHDRWRHLTPLEYGITLAIVGTIGWWLMRFKKR